VAKQPGIVAELGRPETPEETAQRKAAASAKRRSNQTAFNLVIATVASLLIVLFLVTVVVRPNPGEREPVDYRSIAADSGEDVIAPVLPESWKANDARLQTEGGVPTWTIGFVTPATQFIAFDQGLDANPTWLAAAVDGAQPTGTAEIGGLEWTVYDRRGDADTGNYAFILSAESGDDLLVLHGTADDAEFQTIATAVAEEAGA
jgi:hypothetical protein